MAWTMIYHTQGEHASHYTTDVVKRDQIALSFHICIDRLDHV